MLRHVFVQNAMCSGRQITKMCTARHLQLLALPTEQTLDLVHISNILCSGM